MSCDRTVVRRVECARFCRCLPSKVENPTLRQVRKIAGNTFKLPVVPFGLCLVLGSLIKQTLVRIRLW